MSRGALAWIYERAGRELWRSRRRADTKGHFCDYRGALEAVKVKAKGALATMAGQPTNWELVERAISAGFTTFHLSYGAPHNDWYASFFGDPATDRHGAYSRGETPEEAIERAFAKLPQPESETSASETEIVATERVPSDTHKEM